MDLWNFSILEYYSVLSIMFMIFIIIIHFINLCLKFKVHFFEFIPKLLT